MQVPLFLCMQIFYASFAANILFLNTWNSKSHALTMKPFAERLAVKGHNVSIYSITRESMGWLGKGIHSLETIIPSILLLAPCAANSTTIVCKKLVRELRLHLLASGLSEARTEDQGIVGKLFWYMEMTPVVIAHPHLIGFEYLTHSVQDDMFQKVMSTPFDLIILDELFPTAQSAMALAMQKKFSSKLALFSTTDPSSQHSFDRGFCRNPVISPSFYTKTYNVQDYDVLRFIDRLTTLKDVIVEQFFAAVMSSQWMQKAGDVLNVPNSYKIIYEASSATFTDFPSRFGFPSSQSRDLIDIAEHCQEAKKLPLDLRQFVEDPKSKGTIYVAFGSIVTWTVAPPEAAVEWEKRLKRFSVAKLQDIARPHIAKQIATFWRN
ncbi:hypothetical protein KIN20_006832 [Parelaphostrongylus tenuis]|uniref:glucuronosyltransferase n=1 Tax=Parelaphostrongylus tenuis TaxID=148309 RepID=A0AAD5M4C3_PARTN|nr:hypothetical protein KIN20_006832 [Parelaphostrongylus tenuis]